MIPAHPPWTLTPCLGFIRQCRKTFRFLSTLWTCASTCSLPHTPHIPPHTPPTQVPVPVCPAVTILPMGPHLRPWDDSPLHSPPSHQWVLQAAVCGPQDVLNTQLLPGTIYYNIANSVNFCPVLEMLPWKVLLNWIVILLWLCSLSYSYSTVRSVCTSYTECFLGACNSSNYKEKI